MSADLIAFVRARLDSEERRARAAPQGPWVVSREPGRLGLDWTIFGQLGTTTRYDRATDSRVRVPQREEIAGPGYEGGGVWSREAADHIARHDPAHVLRDIEAKRALIDKYEEAVTFYNDPANRHVSAGEITGLRTALACAALPYGDHPDYDEEFRP
ncbi:DUF6221 family protein [Streptomyces atriruber]|uniref:DUF6221 family protein n=1 Tax=Streptomyces atriruber TaxID=545121 RepID=UPI0006E29E7A|nr:DUF6221 family protein [Streptomyces atriruber]